MSRRTQPTVRELVQELGQHALYLGHRDAVGRQAAVRNVRRLAGELERITRPPASAPAAKPKLPGEGTVARAVLERLAMDQLGKDHDELRMLTGLTDAELVARIVVNGRDAAASANTVRPRRVELVRKGLVEAVPDTSPARWRLTAMAEVLLTAQGVKCSRADHTVHLVQEQDRSRRVCDGQPYTPPVTKHGDLLTLCQACARPVRGAARRG